MFVVGHYKYTLVLNGSPLPIFMGIIGIYFIKGNGILITFFHQSCPFIQNATGNNGAPLPTSLHTNHQNPPWVRKFVSLLGIQVFSTIYELTASKLVKYFPLWRKTPAITSLHKYISYFFIALHTPQKSLWL